MGLLVLLAPGHPPSAAPCPLAESFGAPAFVRTASPQRHVTTADLDRNGALDLLVSTSDAIEVHLAERGAGGLSYRRSYRQPTGAGAMHAAVADFDSDGVSDFALARDGGGVMIFRGNGTAGVGDGTFVQQVTYDVGSAWDVLAADLDTDGVLDLLASTRTGIKLLKGQASGGRGNGTFALSRTFVTPGLPKGLAVADVDHDGALDIVFGTERDYIGLMRGQRGESGPTGMFSVAERLEVAGGSTYDVCVADFNGDGMLDIASANYLDGSVSVIVQGPALRVFATEVWHPVPGVTLGLAVADIDQDGRPDLLAGSASSGGTFSILPNEGPSSAQPDGLGSARLFGPARGTYGLAIADLDGDQRADLLAAGLGDSLLAWFPGRCESARVPLTTAVRGFGGRILREPALLSYAPGTSVTLTAVGAPGEQFVGWSGDATGESASVTLVMDRPRSVTAEFRVARYSLSVVVEGSGQVTRSVTAASYAYGTLVLLTAQPASEHLFAGWGGDASGTAPNLLLTMDAHKSVTASFEPDTRMIPAIVSVSDAPEDEGGYVLVTWRASHYEHHFPDAPRRIVRYDVWRERPAVSAGSGAQQGAWELVAATYAAGAPEYVAHVPTFSDSGPAGVQRTRCFVRAATVGGVVAYDSAPDSGYSVDNVAPMVLRGTRAVVERGTTRLAWDPSPARDLAGYRVHRGATADFAPQPANAVAFTPTPAFEESFIGPAWYSVMAVDRNGNAGPASTVQVGALPEGAGFGIERVAPNPSPGGELAVQFFLAHPERATLELLDLQGRRVQSRDVPGAVGEHRVAFGERGRVLPGIYWVRLRQGGRTDQARAVVAD